MTSSLFVDFIHHLGEFKASGRCLLVFDGASCHLDYTIVEAADEHDIVLYCLPSNTTHELQPLDKSVNKSFEHHWNDETLSFLYQNPDKKITKAQFNSIFSRLWSKCMTLDNIQNGFKATGLYPFNPDAIPEEAYAPSILTQRPPEQRQLTTENVGQESDQTLHTSPNPDTTLLLSIVTQRPPELRQITTENDDQGNDFSLQVLPIPGTSGQNSRHGVKRPASCSSDKSLFGDYDPHSSSLLHQEHNEVTKRLVDYSSSVSDNADSNIPAEAEPSYLDATIRRPII
ncbi:hypothetical protein O0L34_g12947 [Tuta absoluta]|nr:hypothetical protein O0L34_g12947 [Tuta absoluta]